MKKDEATNGLRDLRGTLEWLKSKELLLETDVEVNGDLEITGLQKHLDGSIPILFENVKGYPHLRAVTNLFGNIAVMNEMFGWANNTDRTKALAQALTHPIPPIEVSQEEAPVYEHIITDDIDVNKWVLAIRHTPLETELTIGSGQSVVVGKYFKEGTHVGYNRMSFRWGNVGTFQAAPGSHMWQVQMEHYDESQGIPITMCFGIPPAANLMAGSGFDYVILPKGCDELGVAGAIQGQPLRIIVGVVLFIAAAAIIYLAYLQSKVKETAGTQRIDLSGDVSIEEIRCRSCNAPLSKEQISVKAGAIFVECEHCGATYQFEEEPKW